jgi:DNA-directed RNA polymerase specialized sigma24 family protein
MQDPSVFYRLPQISSQPPGIQWTIDLKLQRYIQQLNYPDVKLIAYHLVTTPPTPTTNVCLTALLAHIAFTPAHRLYSIHTILQQYYREDLADLYQIGLEIVSDSRGFLSNFDVSRSLNTSYWYPNLYRWSQHKFDLALTDKIRNQKGMSGFKRTNLGLVARATPTKVLKALKGYPANIHPTYLALHFCLTTAVKARRFDTSNPQAADYAEILALYRQRQVMALDYAEIISYLDELGKAVRNYDRLRVTSIDLPLGIGDDTMLDKIPGTQQPLEQAIVAEYETEIDRVKRIVVGLLEALPIDRDRVLLLLYGLALTQTEAGKELQVHQTTVKRNNDKILAILAQDTYRQSREESSLLSSEQLQQIITHLVSLCREYYPDLLDLIIDKDLEMFIDRVQARWEIQFEIDGLAIERLKIMIQ